MASSPGLGILTLFLSQLTSLVEPAFDGATLTTFIEEGRNRLTLMKSITYCISTHGRIQKEQNMKFASLLTFPLSYLVLV